MTATQARGPEVVDHTAVRLVRDMSGHRDLLADLAEWARLIRTSPWEGTRPWPTSSP